MHPNNSFKKFNLQRLNFRGKDINAFLNFGNFEAPIPILSALPSPPINDAC